ncbi:hypothetical protein DRP98_08325 [candidate division KSB1 bacterium]|nr:MAG: hypothetical protein DRP98_08325 [candidate division KSB1 bacterium]
MQTEAVKIFLLDREQSVAEVVQRLLSSVGYEVEVFSSAKVAFEAIPAKRPQLVISEVELAEGNGIDLCAQIRENYSALPVLFLTTVRELEQRLEALRSGAIDYITKPFDRQLLLAKIENILRLVHSCGEQVQSLRCHKTIPNLLVELQQAGVQTIVPQPDVQSKYGYSYPVLDRISTVSSDAEERISVLEKLSSEGWLGKKIYDVVKLCPNCQSFNVNFRVVCPFCHFPGLEEGLPIPDSNQIRLDQDENSDKEQVPSTAIIRTRHYFCPQCQKTFPEATVFGRCLRCGKNFDEKDAKVQIIYSYYIQDAKLNGTEIRANNSQLVFQALTACELKSYEFRFLRPFLELELREAKLSNKEFALVSFQVTNLTEYVHREGEDVARRSLRNLFLVVKKFLRPLDVIFLAEHDGIEIVLRHTSQQIAQLFVTRLQSYLERLDRKLAVKLKLVTFPKGHESASESVSEDSPLPTLAAQET